MLFLLLTVVLTKVDIQLVGPEESAVGLATVNGFLFRKLGVRLIWYSITDWLGVVAILVAFGFAVLGLVQLVKRKSLFKVYADILLLGVYYLMVIGRISFLSDSS